MSDRARFELLAGLSMNEGGCPPADELAALLLGSLGGSDQLRVAAHVRGCPLCQELIAVARPPAPRARPLLAGLLPRALLPGRRGGADEAHLRRYAVGELAVELILPPPEAGRWRITGQLLRAGAGVPFAPVSLRAGRRRYAQQADDLGFFGFAGLPAGSYRLRLSAGDELVELPELVLGGDEL